MRHSAERGHDAIDYNSTDRRIGGTAIEGPLIVIDLAADCGARWLTDPVAKIDSQRICMAVRLSPL